MLEGRRPDLEQLATIECKHFFSGAAAYANDRIFMTLTPSGLALKLCASDRATVLDLGGTPLRYFAKAPIKKDYVVLPQLIRSDEVALGAWIRTSVEFCRSLPLRRRAKTARRGRRPAR